MQFFSVFAREVGVTAKVLGFIMSIRNLLSGLFQGTIGRLSDRIGRKYILIVGFILSFVIPIPLMFYHNPYFLIFVAVIQAFSVSIIIPTWNAVLGDVTEPSSRATFIGKITSVGRIFSVAISLTVAGVFALIENRFNDSITIGGNIIEITWEIEYGFAFGVAAFNALLCLISMFFLKETRVVSEEKRNHIPKMWVALKDKSFVKFLIVNSFFGITMSLIWPVNPIILSDFFGLDFPQVAVMTSAFAIFIGITTIFGGKICDRIGRKPLIVIANFILVFFPVSMIPAIITGNWLVLLLSRFVGGVGTGLSLVAINAYTLDIAPSDLMGAYSGIREMFYGVTTFIGSFASGFIIDALDLVYDIRIVVIAMSIGVTSLRIIAATGFIFIDKIIPNSNGLTKDMHAKS
ncbi:MAG: MFS transporter [Candidatus Heimdallarchaeota archaeon]